MSLIFKKVAESKQHKQLVDGAIYWLVKNGYKILGAHRRKPQYNTPPKLNAHIPDIYAAKDNMQIAVEAERCEEIGTEDSKKQWQAFRKWADADKNRQFWLSVPRRCLLSDGTERSGCDYAREQGIKIDFCLETQP